eukprot:gene2808-10481_t
MGDVPWAERAGGPVEWEWGAAGRACGFRRADYARARRLLAVVLGNSLSRRLMFAVADVLGGPNASRLGADGEEVRGREVRGRGFAARAGGNFLSPPGHRVLDLLSGGQVLLVGTRDGELRFVDPAAACGVPRAEQEHSGKLYEWRRTHPGEAWGAATAGARTYLSVQTVAVVYNASCGVPFRDPADPFAGAAPFVVRKQQGEALGVVLRKGVVDGGAWWEVERVTPGGAADRSGLGGRATRACVVRACGRVGSRVVAVGGRTVATLADLRARTQHDTEVRLMLLPAGPLGADGAAAAAAAAVPASWRRAGDRTAVVEGRCPLSPRACAALPPAPAYGAAGVCPPLLGSGHRALGRWARRPLSLPDGALGTATVVPAGRGVGHGDRCPCRTGRWARRPLSLPDGAVAASAAPAGGGRCRVELRVVMHPDGAAGACGHRWTGSCGAAALARLAAAIAAEVRPLAAGPAAVEEGCREGHGAGWNGFQMLAWPSGPGND